MDMLINSNIYENGVLLSGTAKVNHLDLGRLTGIESLGECSLYTKQPLLSGREVSRTCIHALTLCLSAVLPLTITSFGTLKCWANFKTASLTAG